ncbi:hypothetical protein EFT36_04990 [Raoultella ornithinolytica]|nr:hypothetical protein EFT36_04990 [Raoultella ornithinolytica]HCJ05029.1 hypothetical protein [Raoultella ornithinolytica]
MPAMGRFSPFVILIISLAGIRNLNLDIRPRPATLMGNQRKGKAESGGSQDGREASFLTLIVKRRKCNIS